MTTNEMYETETKIQESNEGEMSSKNVTKNGSGDIDEIVKDCKSIEISNTSKDTELKKRLSEYLDELKKKMRRHRMLPESAPYYKMPLALIKSLCHFIWDVDFLRVDEVICSRMYRQLQYEFFMMGSEQSDLDDFLEFKPVEIIAAKCTQILIKIASGAVDTACNELGNLDKLLSDKRIKRDNENELGFHFLATTLRLTLNVLADIEAPSDEEIPHFENLNSRSQCVVNGAKVYLMKTLRAKPTERLALLKKVTEIDTTGVEWLVTLGEIIRRKRRESMTAKARRAAPEEYQMLTVALTIAKDNPFVIMGLIDFIIDHLRDSKGCFRLADMNLESQEEIMTSLQSYCRYIIMEYPKSVSFTSIISDYFLRYVPFAYFDIPFGGETLQRAHALNPENPKTTHRLGIYHRMSMQDSDESFKWFRKTIELDPSHFNAVMEYYKTAIKELDSFDVVKAMLAHLHSKELDCWSENEIHEFKFLLSLACFAKGEKEEALKLWEEIVQKNQIIFRLQDLDRTCGFYHWDGSRLSSDKLRLWMKAEKDAMAAKAKQGELVDERRKNVVDLLFSLMLGGGRPSKMESHNAGPFNSGHEAFGGRFQNMIDNVQPL